MIKSGKPIVLRCASATLGLGGRVTVTDGGDAAAGVLSNFSRMADVANSE